MQCASLCNARLSRKSWIHRILHKASSLTTRILLASGMRCNLSDCIYPVTSQPRDRSGSQTYMLAGNHVQGGDITSPPADSVSIKQTGLNGPVQTIKPNPVWTSFKHARNSTTSNLLHTTDFFEIIMSHILCLEHKNIWPLLDRNSILCVVVEDVFNYAQFGVHPPNFGGVPANFRATANFRQRSVTMSIQLPHPYPLLKAKASTYCICM